MSHEIRLDTPKQVNPSQLIAELEALAIAGVRTYSVFGTEGVSGVYAWDDSAPAGEYQHITLSDVDKQKVLDAIAAHVPQDTTPRYVKRLRDLGKKAQTTPLTQDERDEYIMQVHSLLIEKKFI